MTDEHVDDPIPIGRAIEGLNLARSRLGDPAPVAPEPDRVVVVDHLASQREMTWEYVIPRRFHAARLGDLAPLACGQEIVDWISEWMEHRGRASNLVLLGPVGTGKTRAACVALRLAHQAGREIRFAPVVEMLDQLRPGPDSVPLSTFTTPDLLLLDDVGHERSTDWSHDRFDAVVNRRWLEERPTIATSNLEPDALAAAIGERAYSRLVRSGAVVLHLGGEDRRRS